MGLVRVLLVTVVVLGAVGLMTGVLQLFREHPDGTAKFDPHVSHGAATWYRTRTLAAIGPERAESLKSGVRRLLDPR